MDRAKKLMAYLKSFNKWEIGGSSTQFSARTSEDFVEDCIKKSYPKSKIYKMGSQQHPDFMVVPIKHEEPIEKFRKAMKKRKVTLKVLRDWEASEYNQNKIRIVRVEVKTGVSVYTLNDTFPNPFRENDEIYILFSIDEKKIYVVTSSSMAEKCQTIPTIKERYKKSTQIVQDFGNKLKDVWKDVGISTASRPTYRMNKEYAHHEASMERVRDIFAEAGF